VVDDAHAAGMQRRARLPRRQQVLDDCKQPLLGPVPRLEQVVVQRDLVDEQRDLIAARAQPRRISSASAPDGARRIR